MSAILLSGSSGPGVSAASRRRAPISPAFGNVKFHIDGDSIPAGIGTPAGFNFQNALTRTFPGVAVITNNAVSGDNIQARTAAAPTGIDLLLVNDGFVHVVIFWCGTNDLVSQLFTPAQTYGFLTTYAQGRRAAAAANGVPHGRFFFVYLPVMSRGNGANPPQFDIDRATFNAMVSADHTTPQIDVWVSNIIGDPIVGTDQCWINEYYFNDGLAGNTTIAPPSGGMSLPQATINVTSAAGMGASGTAVIGIVGTSVRTAVFYTGKTATSITGCSGGTGLLTNGAGIAQGTDLTHPTAAGIVVPVMHLAKAMQQYFRWADAVQYNVPGVFYYSVYSTANLLDSIGNPVTNGVAVNTWKPSLQVGLVPGNAVAPDALHRPTYFAAGGAGGTGRVAASASRLDTGATVLLGGSTLLFYGKGTTGNFVTWGTFAPADYNIEFGTASAFTLADGGGANFLGTTPTNPNWFNDGAAHVAGYSFDGLSQQTLTLDGAAVPGTPFSGGVMGQLSPASLAISLFDRSDAVAPYTGDAYVILGSPVKLTAAQTAYAIAFMQSQPLLSF